MKPTGHHLGPLFEPLKNLMLAGRGTNCRASYIAGRCVMENFAVKGVDANTLQHEAAHEYATLMASHSNRAYDHPPAERLFHPVYPWASEN